MPDRPQLATVREVMTPNPVTTAAGAPAAEALREMEEVGCRHLPVMEGDRLVGILAKKDVSCDCSRSRRVGELMSRQLHTASPDETVDVAAATMAVSKVDCLPVLEDGRLVGILTTYDVLDLVCRRFRADPSFG
jgi:CBS domain-containing protein